MPTFSNNSANTTDPQCPGCVTYTRIVLKYIKQDKLADFQNKE